MERKARWMVIGLVLVSFFVFFRHRSSDLSYPEHQPPQVFLRSRDDQLHGNFDSNEGEDEEEYDQDDTGDEETRRKRREEAMGWLNGKTVMITGASGFIGCNLIRFLIENLTDTNVVGIDIVPFGVLSYHHPIQSTRWHFELVDVRNETAMREVFEEYKDISVVYHLAAVRYSLSEFARLVNWEPLSQTLLELVEEFDIPHFIFTSSTRVYAPSVSPVNEASPLSDDSSMHIKEKLWVEGRLQTLSSSTKWTVFRLHDVFGPFQILTDGYAGGMHASCEFDFVQPTFVMDIVGVLVSAPGVSGAHGATMNVGASKVMLAKDVMDIVANFSKQHEVGDLESRLVSKGKAFFHGIIDHSSCDSTFYFLQSQDRSIEELLTDALAWHRDNLQATMVAIIIESRPAQLLSSFSHFLAKLVPDGWLFRVYTSEASFSVLHQHYGAEIASGRVSVSRIWQPVGNYMAHNRMLMSEEFYADQVGEHILYYQTDSVLCSGATTSLYDYIDYSFIGAPWGSMIACNGYNGGISLRLRSSMLETIRFNNKHKAFSHTHEDYFFCEVWRRMRNSNLNLPPANVAEKFSVESVFYETPVAVHKFWGHFNVNQTRQLLQNCPEAWIVFNFTTKFPEITQY